VFVAELNGATVGFSAIEPRSNGGIELDALFVDPNVRRHGVGRLMVEHCATVARKKGSTVLHVIGNPHAREFYLAFETRFGVGLLMKKDL
jgi:GNAT superfamily N-acetyltransferase